MLQEMTKKVISDISTFKADIILIVFVNAIHITVTPVLSILWYGLRKWTLSHLPEESPEVSLWGPPTHIELAPIDRVQDVICDGRADLKWIIPVSKYREPKQVNIA